MCGALEYLSFMWVRRLHVVVMRVGLFQHTLHIKKHSVNT